MHEIFWKQTTSHFQTEGSQETHYPIPCSHEAQVSYYCPFAFIEFTQWLSSESHPFFVLPKGMCKNIWFSCGFCWCLPMVWSSLTNTSILTVSLFCYTVLFMRLCHSINSFFKSRNGILFISASSFSNMVTEISYHCFFSGRNNIFYYFWKFSILMILIFVSPNTYSSIPKPIPFSLR